MKQPKESTYIFIFYLNYSWVFPPTVRSHKHMGGREQVRWINKDFVTVRACFCAARVTAAARNILLNGACGMRWTLCFGWMWKPLIESLHICYHKIQVSIGKKWSASAIAFAFFTLASHSEWTLKTFEGLFTLSCSTPLCWWRPWNPQRLSHAFALLEKRHSMEVSRLYSGVLAAGLPLLEALDQWCGLWKNAMP